MSMQSTHPNKRHCSYNNNNNSSSSNYNNIMNKRAHYAGFLIILICLHTAHCAPLPQQDEENPFQTNSISGATDYNTMVGHFKDLVMYFPVMMSTLKDTMTGFPKFAEGIRILTSKSGRLPDEDCKCHGGRSNEIDNSSHYS